jgi:hypothetical protein
MENSQRIPGIISRPISPISPISLTLSCNDCDLLLKYFKMNLLSDNNQDGRRDLETVTDWQGSIRNIARVVVSARNTTSIRDDEQVTIQFQDHEAVKTLTREISKLIVLLRVLSRIGKVVNVIFEYVTLPFRSMLTIIDKLHWIYRRLQTSEKIKLIGKIFWRVVLCSAPIFGFLAAFGTSSILPIIGFVILVIAYIYIFFLLLKKLIQRTESIWRIEFTLQTQLADMNKLQPTNMENMKKLTQQNMSKKLKTVEKL